MCSLEFDRWVLTISKLRRQHMCPIGKWRRFPPYERLSKRNKLCFILDVFSLFISNGKFCTCHLQSLHVVKMYFNLKKKRNYDIIYLTLKLSISSAASYTRLYFREIRTVKLHEGWVSSFLPAGGYFSGNLESRSNGQGVGYFKARN